ncbi:glycoside hydrolase N-terminal domain-containing protein [Paenibacillus sp. HWE-109]|uniref:glycosyl hydrolase family 95 catalytic domain-containing protein n=1 Tax=Paenibacillus sp. HWE-109 TaxID=1306526 RepID=UPI001EDCA0E5|nr:glycoside hydrolase N-terminal domain-containing protein [Paenibacillus sp. HWE-109]UKS24104.1 glycoside hydrolase N-terminal domain-containing protein [Paenibacillus sp. HWE-109]
MIIRKLRKMTAITTSLSLLVTLLLASGVPSISQASAAETGNSEMPVLKTGNWDDLKINWTTPASGTDFNGAPVGNGYFGAKVSGGVATEILQLNDKTFNSGEPFNRSDPNRITALDATRSLLAGADTATTVTDRENKLKSAETAAMGMWGSEKLAEFLPIGNIVLDVPNTTGYTNYDRELHLDKSIVTTKYKVGNTTYTREVFASNPDRVMVVRMTNDSGQPMSMTAKMELPAEMNTHGTVSSSGSEIQMTGTAPYDDYASQWENGRGMTFDARLRARTTGGTITAVDGNLNISNAAVIELLYADATSYKDPFTNPNPSQGGNNPTPIVTGLMDAAFAKTYTQLLDVHQADHRSLFRRLWTEANGNSKPFTLTYQYARYVSIAGSRANTFDRPLNQNGMWMNKWYTNSYGAHWFNENVEKTYTLIEAGNLRENGDPLWKYLKNLSINGAKTAQSDFGFDGWMVPQASDLWAKTELSAGDNEWAIWLTGGMWLMFNMYDHYRFTQDKSYLQGTAFPLMKGSAEFALDLLVTNKDGYLVASPSSSPETKYVLSDGTPIAVSQGSTIDMTVIRELFENVLEAGNILEANSPAEVDLLNRIRTALPKLLPYQIGSSGEIKEWNNDYSIVDPSHRHASHLIGVGFLDQITKKYTPELFNAVKVSLNMRGSGGYHPDSAFMWARLYDGDRAISLADIYPTSEFVNEWQVRGGYYPELFVQSHVDNIIDLLPALPSTWTTGNFSGIMARGGFEVGVSWTQSRATSIQVKSLAGTRAKLSYPNIAGAIVTNQDGQNVAYTTDSSNQISFDTQVGDVYTISSIPSKDGQLYTLKMKISGQMLEIAGASSDEQASLIQMPSSGATNQQWQVVSLGNGYNKIVNSKSNKAIAVLGASASDGAQLVQQTYTADADLTDEWQLVDQANGYYKLVNRGSGKALTVPSASSVSGTQLVQSSLTNADNQLVKVNPVSDPFDQKTFNLTVQNSQLRMDVDGGSNADGTKIIQWSAGTALNQQWKFIKTDPGYYKIISQKSSKVLVVENASTVDGAGIVQNGYTQDANYNDEWSVVDVGDGFFQLQNRGSGKVIEIPGSSQAGGVQFVQRTAGTGSNQKFLLSFDRTTNDNATGLGNDQFMYGQDWGYTASESGAYSGDNHYSNVADAYVLLRFTGSKVKLYGAKNNNQGIAAISIDDGPESLVDTYAPSRSDQHLLFESKDLANQEHVLRIRVTGQKSASANNTFVSIDRADIQSRIEKSAVGNYFSQSTEKINGVDHTVITLNYTGDDAGDAVRAAIEAAKVAPKPVILDFPAGIYPFKASTANNAQYYISNASSSGQTPGGWRKVGLLFKDISDLTIRGNGSTLLFHGVMTPIVFDHATNVKVNGINIDFNRPVVSEMTVTEVGTNYMKASIHPDSWYTIPNNQLSWIGEENWTQNGTQNVGAVQEYDPLTKKTWRVGNPLNSVTNAQDLGNRVVQFNYASSPNVTVGHTFQLRDTTRREQGTLIYRSKDITWTDVNFYAAPGLGIISQYSENLTLDRLNFAPKAGSGRTNASMADFLQVSGSKGDIRVMNSHFAGAHDDGINVHGTHLQIVQIPASNQVKVQFMHPESWGFDAFAVGDTIEYINKSTLLSKESAVVTGVTRVDDTQIILTLDKTVPASVTANEYVVENTTWTPNVTITNSTFETIPTRGILMTTSGAVRIEDNTFNGMPMSAILIADDANSWYESGMVKDVVIRNNTFNNNGNAVISVEPSTSLANPNKTVHSHIVVDGNQFNQSSGNSAIYAKSVDGFTFTNNTANQGGLDLAFDASKAITVTGNSFAQSDVDKKISFNQMIAGTDSVEASQGFVVTRTNDYTPIVTDPNDIPQSEMTATTTSNRSGNEASNAIDGDPSTIWHTEWDPKANLPQSITLDLGKSTVISKLRYLPRQNGESNGNITSYELSASVDGTSFTPFASGTWSDDSSEKSAVFAPVLSRYLKLSATAGHGGFASAAELHVGKEASNIHYQELVDLIANVQSKHDSAVEGNGNGQYPVGSRQTLQAAIDAANLALGALTQQEIDQAKDDLNQALRAFEASVIGQVQVASLNITSVGNVSTITTKGGSLPLGVMVLPTNATNQTVTWAVYEADGAVTDKAIINLTGLLTAVKNGTVKVVATANDGSAVIGVKAISISGQNDNSGTSPVNVTSIAVTSASTSINVKGGSLPLGVMVLPTNATNQTVTWAVYEVDGAVTDKALINLTGLLTAVKNGTVKVVATATDGSAVIGVKSISISGQNDNPGTNPGSGGFIGSGNPTLPPVKEDPTKYVPKDTELRIEPVQENQTGVTAIINRERLAQKLADLKAAGSSILNFEMSGEYEKNAVQLPLDILYNSMKENKGTLLTLRSHLGSYNLPLSILNREDVASAVDTEGAVLIISMDKAKSQHEQQFDQSISENGMKRVSDMIDYKVILKAKDKEVEIANFGNRFITRVMNVDGAIQDASIATAVVYDPVTGELKFVPSVFSVKNGKTEATITRNTNSLYAIVQNKKTFDDMYGHWAQKDVENLASKMVIDGTTDRTYTPEMQVTRAQFAALLVRGLGLRAEVTPSVFTDVAATQWYASEVGTAAKYGLVQGVGEGRFNPDQLITREQMVVMMMKAVHLVQGESIPEAVVNNQFSDQDQLSDYARRAVAEAVSKDLVHGKTETTFAPQDAATRAEAAVLIKQAMQYLKLIN